MQTTQVITIQQYIITVGIIPHWRQMLNLYNASDRWVNECWWNDTDLGGDFNTFEKNLSQRNFVHNKLHMDWQGDWTQTSIGAGWHETAWAMA
jgi:hypothetical protein